MIESFVTVLNGVITGKHHGDITGDLFGTPFYGHKKQIVPFDAEIVPMELVEFYDENWKRKPVVQLIGEGLLPMPEGYILENNALRPMTAAERILAGLDTPQTGYKIVSGEIVEMAIQEKINAGIITREEYDCMRAAENEAELQRRLAELQTPEALARAEIDNGFAAGRKAALAALLAVKAQSGWPVSVEWP